MDVKAKAVDKAADNAASANFMMISPDAALFQAA